MKMGREKPISPSPPPVMSPSLRIHPGVILIANLSLIIFIITTRRYDWKLASGLWIGSLILSLLESPQPLKPIKKMSFAFPFLLITLAIHALFTSGTVLFRLGNIFITKEGIFHGIWITQKLAFFFWISLVITSNVPASILFQLMGRLSNLYIFRRVRLWIIALFLIIRWLHILPISWRKQLSEHIKDVPGKFRKTLSGLRYLPQLVRETLTQIDQWNTLLVLRGYSEGILWIADSPMPPLKRLDTLIMLIISLLWGLWIVYLA